MTMSVNIAGTVRPLGMSRRGDHSWDSSKVYHVSALKPKGKKKKTSQFGRYGMMYVEPIDGINEAYTVPVGNPKDNLWKIPSLGKVGMWRTIRGRRYFFPSDGSGPVPKIKGVKQGPKGRNLYDVPKEKKGLLKKIAGFLGGGGGAKAGLKDVKPKGEKKKKATGGSGESIPSREKTLKQVQQVIAKAGKTKSGRSVVSSLKKMQKALETNDPKAFRKAEAGLARATSKMAKKRR